jgi:hypothetical protein
MKFIWEQVSQPDPQGRRWIRYGGRHDIVYLYETGFVDTDKYPLNEWIDAFKDSLQKDGRYVLDENQWMAKKKYRYDGPIDAPFDPLSMPEKMWNPEEFEKLLKEKILPSMAIPEKIFRESLQRVKDRMFVNGKVNIDKQFKAVLKQIMETSPSPRRFREVSLAEAVKKMGQGAPKTGVPSAPSQAAQQKSGFAKGPAAGQAAVDQLSKLLGKR